MRYFTLDEFDSPDLPGSGAFMQDEFLEKLDAARGYAEVPFRITSGFRTPSYQQDLKKRGYKVSETSAHLDGWAADISATTSNRRWKIIEALIYVGFNRIGVADSFVHVDMDPGKAQNCLWLY